MAGESIHAESSRSLVEEPSWGGGRAGGDDPGDAEVVEDTTGHAQVGQKGDHAETAAAAATDQDVDLVDAGEEVGPVESGGVPP